MTYLKTVAGALAIMMASGMIADFEVTEADNNEILVLVWSVDDQPDAHMRAQVEALLTRRASGAHVSVLQVNA
jgi:hypothetical protein